MVRGDEICGQTITTAKGEKIVNPSIRGSRGSADSQCAVHTLDGLHRVTVEFEIIALFTAAKCRQVRLIPYLEKPLSNLVPAITLAPMVHQSSDQHRPLSIIL